MRFVYLCRNKITLKKSNPHWLIWSVIWVLWIYITGSQDSLGSDYIETNFDMLQPPTDMPTYSAPTPEPPRRFVSMFHLIKFMDSTKSLSMTIYFVVHEGLSMMVWPVKLRLSFCHIKVYYNYGLVDVRVKAKGQISIREWYLYIEQ